jgi:hypothetical protein
MGPDHCPQGREVEPGLLVADVGPSGMQPIISLPDFGGLEAKILTLGFSPLQVGTIAVL